MTGHVDAARALLNAAALLLILVAVPAAAALAALLDRGKDRRPKPGPVRTVVTDLTLANLDIWLANRWRHYAGRNRT